LQQAKFFWDNIKFLFLFSLDFIFFEGKKQLEIFDINFITFNTLPVARLNIKNQSFFTMQKTFA
jgi:hypothetical protein